MAGKKTKDTGSVYDDIDPAKRKMLKRSENSTMSLTKLSIVSAM